MAEITRPIPTCASTALGQPGPVSRNRRATANTTGVSSAQSIHHGMLPVMAMDQERGRSVQSQSTYALSDSMTPMPSQKPRMGRMGRAGRADRLDAGRKTRDAGLDAGR